MKTSSVAAFLGLAIVILGGALIFYEGGFFSDIPRNGDIAIVGQVVCLPLKESAASAQVPSAAETREIGMCVFGLLGEEDGHYYQLADVASTGTSVLTGIAVGSRVQVRGVFTRGSDEMYESVGSILVETILLLNGFEDSAPGTATTTATSTTIRIKGEWSLAPN